MSQLQEIESELLSEADIPPPNADLDLIFRFALKYDGYERCGSHKACAEIANAQLGGSLHNLRTCLFFEQRRAHHVGEELNEEDMAYLHRVIEEIRTLIKVRPAF